MQAEQTQPADPPNGPSAAPPTTPTAKPQERPKAWPTVVGLIAAILGGLSLSSSILGWVLHASPLGSMFQQSNTPLHNAMFILGIVGLPVSLMHLAGGVMLSLRRRIGYSLLLWFAPLAIILNIANGIAQAAFQPAAQQQGATINVIPALSVTVAVIGIVMMSAWPAFLWTWLLLPSSKAERGRWTR